MQHPVYWEQRLLSLHPSTLPVTPVVIAIFLPIELNNSTFSTQSSCSIVLFIPRSRIFTIPLRTIILYSTLLMSICFFFQRVCLSTVIEIELMHRGKHVLRKFAIATSSLQTNAKHYVPPGIQEGNVPAVTIREIRL